MFSSLPFNENGEENNVDFLTGEEEGILFNDDEQYKDLTRVSEGDLVNARSVRVPLLMQVP